MKKFNNEERVAELEYKLICDFIKLRGELGLTQKEMGEASNTIREIIAVIETQKKHPQINTLIKILEPYGYTLSITKIEGE
ncbi:MAG: helix-turn-helix domain-containing protein [Bacilli bacterium]|nr:helix-turn-helix domain-containing protein [Bacilli bacterium]